MDASTGQEEEGQRKDTRSREEITDPSSIRASPQTSQNRSRSDDSHAPSEVTSSPVGSQTSQSTSSRRGDLPRIVELLQNNDENSDNSHREENWMIGEEFYHEDVAAEDNNIDISDDSASDDSRISEVGDPESTAEEDDQDEDDVGVLMGFELAPNEFDRLSEQSSEEEDQRDEGENAIQYDISIPIEHRYLGQNLEESRGRRILVENSIVTLPLFNLKNIVLLPGQLLPITTGNLNPRIHAYLQSCISRGDCLIGLISGPRDNPLGTTAEIRNYTRSSEEGEEEMRIIMEGRQRFKLLSQPFDTAIEGLVTILPEVSLGHPYPELPSWKRLMTNKVTPAKYIVSKHPKWLLRSYEAHYIAKRIMNQIVEWCSKAPRRDPNDFSYWVASNLPISNAERIELLKFDCTEARLLWLLRLLEKNEYLGCSDCQNRICHRTDVFLMSCSGPQNSFVNPNGFVHDTLTVSKASNLVYQYSWTSEHTWFPGYEWRIVCCDVCNRHIGWCYRTTLPDTKPKRFWGLSRANVRLQSAARRILCHEIVGNGNVIFGNGGLIILR